MLKIQEENLKDCIEEMKPLLAEHYKEVAVYQDKIEFNPDYERYLDMNVLGFVRVFTIRDEGKLVGYSLYLLNPNIHYKDHLYAVNDVIYVDPEYRGSTAAYRLMKLSEKTLKAAGVSVMTIHMKTYLPFERLCQAFDMDKVEYLYMKYIGD